jgi:hypothetical protein
MNENNMIKKSTINFKYTTINPTSNQYKELHNSLFKGANISKDWINWYHKDVPSSLGLETITYAAFDGEILVGIWSVEPKLMNINGEIIKVGRCFSVGIHENYRRLGLFVTLSEFAIKSEKNRSEFDYIIGFPQKGRSVIGGHLKAGWEIIHEISIYSADKFEYENYPLSNVEKITDFNLINFENNLEGSLIESPQYRNIRWLNHPDIHYIGLKYNNSFIILKTYSNFCHIVDINGEKKDIVHLLKTVKNLALRHGWVEVNLWCANNEFFKDEIIATGFKKGANFGLPISVIAVKINESKPLLLIHCHIQMGAEEGY